MLRSRASSSILAALLFTSVAACAASVSPVAIPPEEGQSGNPPVLGQPAPSGSNKPDTPAPPPAEKVTFAYASVPLPAAGARIAAIGGSSPSDVWAVASTSASSTTGTWTAYHYDGTSWTPTALSAQTGRPSFGVASLGGNDVYLGFSYSAEIFKRSGASFTSRTSYSVTTGYTLAAVGSKIYVGTQENFSSGPLYVLDATSSKQVPVGPGGGVFGIWGSSEDDVWLARAQELGHVSGGKYESVDPTPMRGVSGTAKDDVWAITNGGVRHYDGKAWSDVTFPGSDDFADSPRTITALAKDEVIVTTHSNVYRYDGKAFVADERAGAPTSGSVAARIGKDEAWVVGASAIGRLAPEKKK